MYSKQNSKLNYVLDFCYYFKQKLFKIPKLEAKFYNFFDTSCNFSFFAKNLSKNLKKTPLLNLRFDFGFRPGNKYWYLCVMHVENSKLGTSKLVKLNKIKSFNE